MSETEVLLSPANFFQMSLECHHASSINAMSDPHYLLPEGYKLCGDSHFADVRMGWNSGGLLFQVDIKQAFQAAFFPSLTEGDSVELLVDTRDLKSAGFNHRFCHHFFFLPQEVNGHRAAEMTHFRTEDVHELCDKDALILKSVKESKGYQMYIEIPASCLHGYDPDQFDRLGFTYRINRPNASSQHFSVVTEDYVIDQQPSLWSSVTLVQ